MASPVNGPVALAGMLAALGTTRRGPAADACNQAEKAFGLGAELRAAGATIDALRSLSPERRPFAFEGAGLVDALVGSGSRTGAEAFSPDEQVFYDLGRGIAFAVRETACPDDVRLSEGHGFAMALLRPAKALMLTAAAAEWDVGVGRGLWFVHAGAVPRLRAAVQSCAATRRQALWNGVARAAIFTGGGPPDRLRALLSAAGEHAEAVLAGAEIAALLRGSWALGPVTTVPPLQPPPADCAGTRHAESAATVPGVAAVRGIGAVSVAGSGTGALMRLLRSGKSGIAPVLRFPTDAFGVHTAALVPGHDSPAMTHRPDGTAQALALAFARGALTEALASVPPASGVTALVVGSNVEDRPRTLDELFGLLAHEFGIDGPQVVVSTACASGTSAIGHALGILARGEADRVLVGGVDVITPRVFAGFSVLGALATHAAPFSDPPGMTPGEGAAFLVLERAFPNDPTCLLGYGLGADAFHETQPATDGHGVMAAVRSALAHAGLTPSAIRYVNAHGTGTTANDAPEWMGIRAGLSGHSPPTSSAKGLFGHAQGAAGALEVVYTLVCRAEGLLPPTTGFGVPRPGAPPDPVPVLRVGDASTFLSCSSAFGGVNAAVAFGPARPIHRPQRPVFVAGAGVWGPPVGGELPPGVTAADLPRRVDPDGLGAPVSWLCAAINRALAAAGIKLDRSTRARTGLVLGTRRLLAHDGKRLGDEIEACGLEGVAASAFTSALLVTPAGAASMTFGTLGPLDVVVAGAESGALALVHAATLLSERPELDLMIAASVDDPEPGRGWSGAAAAVLSSKGGRALNGWTLAGSAKTAEAALRRRFPETANTATGSRADDNGGAAAAAGLLAVADQLGQVQPSLLVGGRPGLGWALALGGPE